MFFVDKYGTYCSEDLMFHKDILDMLGVISKDDSVPHLIFYGPSGCGKKMIIHRFLEMLYGTGVHKTKPVQYEVAGSGTTKTMCTIQQSNYHIVIEPNNNNFDRYVIHDIVKEYAQKMPLQFINTKRKFKTVLINNIGNLSYFAQTSLRRTMEKYSRDCRFIMWSESQSLVIDPIRSRCFCFRVTPPTTDDIVKTLTIVSANENINLSLSQLTTILRKCDGSLKQALWLLELLKHTGDTTPFFIKTISVMVDFMLELKLENIRKIRAILYPLMITTVPESKIMVMITNELLSRQLSDCVREKIIDKAEIYEHRLAMARRQIFQLDAFVIAVMTAIVEDVDKTAKKKKKKKIMNQKSLTS